MPRRRAIRSTGATHHLAVSMPSTRRALLKSLLASPFIGLATARAQQQSALQAAAAAVGDGQVIGRQALIDFAREVSRAPFQPARMDVPRAFTQLTPDQYRGIRLKQEARLFAGENRGFTVEPLHAGNVFTTPVMIRTVENGVIRDIRFSPDLFDYSGVGAPPAEAPLAFTGFRLRGALNGAEIGDEVMIAQGASFFRLLARAQNFGIMARALAVNIGEPTGEEFPAFRAFWIERPGVGANALVIHGLVDSESVTGLFRFAVRPGDVTVCDVEVNLFPRVDLGHVGLAPMSCNFFFAPNDRAGVDDVRNAVHEANGLQCWTGAGEWLWRPLHNPETLQISSFVDQNPKGFGLMQRDRRFEAFNDFNARFERRPSAWIEPLGDWGPGQVQLVEIPVQDDVNRNIIVYWRPRGALARGQEHAFTYRMHWCWQPPERPPGAWSSGVRIGRAPGGARRRRFLVDFVADDFANAAVMSGIRPNLTTHRGRILGLEGRLMPEIRTYRVAFDLDPEAANQVELRMILERDGQPASETWLYRWTP